MAEKGKDVQLSLVIRTVDRYSAKLKDLNERLDKTFKPLKDLKSQLGNLYEHSGLGKIASGFKGIASELKGLVTGLGVVAGAAGAATYAFLKLVDEADDLGDTADKVGLTVDALAQLRYAAKRSGSSVEELDAGLASFSKNLGLARAHTGKLYNFLGKVSPALRKQVLAAKSNEEAFGLMANAMRKVQDPAKRAALAAQVFGGAGVALAPLLSKGSKGIAELRDRYARLAGPQGEAAAKAGELKDQLDDLHAATDSVKASLLVGLAPALTDLAKSATEFFVANRERIGAWLREFGEKLPGRLQAVGEAFKAVWAAIKPVVDLIGRMVDLVGGGENAVKLLIGAWLAFKALKIGGHLLEITTGIWKMVTALKAAEVAGGGAGGGIMGALKKGGRLLASPGGAIVAGTAAATYLGVKYNRQFTGAIDKVGLHGVAEAFRGGSGKSTGFSDRVADLRKQGLSEERARLVAAKLMRSAAKTTGTALPDEVKQVLAADKAKRSAAGVAGAGGSGGGSAGVFRQLAALAKQKAEITINIAGAPPGTRVKKDPRSTADVDISTGYQLGATP